jgi:hypothetical protein
LITVVARTAGRWASRKFGWGTDAFTGPRRDRRLTTLVDDGLICTAMVMSVLETAASYKCKSHAAHLLPRCLY